MAGEKSSELRKSRVITPSDTSIGAATTYHHPDWSVSPPCQPVLWAVKTCSNVWSSVVLSWTQLCPRNRNLASETSTTLYTHNPTDCNTLTGQIGANRFIFPDKISALHFHWTTCNNQGNLNRQIAGRVTHYVDEWYNLRFMTICNMDTLQHLGMTGLDKLQDDFPRARAICHSTCIAVQNFALPR